MLAKLKNRQPKKHSQKGFTLIELMIAATVFSTVLILATTGVINLGRLYHKGLTTAKTQETARSVIDELSRSIQLTRGELKRGGNATYKTLCVGQDRYTYSIDMKISEDNNIKGLWLDEVDPGVGCSVPGFSNGKELLGNNMRLLQFDVQDDESDTNKVNIAVGVAYGDSDLLTHCSDDTEIDNFGPCTEGDAANAQCKPTNSGGSFCAVSKLETFVKRRIPVVYLN